MAQWLQERNQLNLGEYLGEVAATGDLDHLQWAVQSFQVEWNSDIQSEVASAAASNGHLPVLKWMDEQGTFPLDPVSLFHDAVSSGSLDTSQWIHAKGIELAPDYPCLSYAARKGNLELLKWLREIGASWDIYVYSCAARAGHVHVLEWLFDQGCPLDDAETVLNLVSSYSLECLRWLHAHGVDLGEAAMLGGVETGKLEVVEWLVSIGYSVERNHLLHALFLRHLHIYQHYSHLYPVETTDGHRAVLLLDAVAGTDDLTILRYFQEQGWYRQHPDQLPPMFQKAVFSGRLQTVRFLLEQRLVDPSVLNRQDLTDRALLFLDRQSDCVPVLEWLLAKKYIQLTAAHFDFAVQESLLAAMRWLHDHRCPWDRETAFRTASQSVRDWIVEKGGIAELVNSPKPARFGGGSWAIDSSSSYEVDDYDYDSGDNLPYY